MKYLLAPDSFKEAASAQAVAESMRRGVAAGEKKFWRQCGN